MTPNVWQMSGDRAKKAQHYAALARFFMTCSQRAMHEVTRGPGTFAVGPDTTELTLHSLAVCDDSDVAVRCAWATPPSHATRAEGRREIVQGEPEGQ